MADRSLAPLKKKATLLRRELKQLEDSASEMSKQGVVRLAEQKQEQAPDTVGAFVPSICN